jgi:alpha-L-fucosidase 2
MHTGQSTSFNAAIWSRPASCQSLNWQSNPAWSGVNWSANRAHRWRVLGLWPTGGAWLYTHLGDRWGYGQDKTYLASIYRLLRCASNSLSMSCSAIRRRFTWSTIRPSFSRRAPQGPVDPCGTGNRHADPWRPVRSDCCCVGHSGYRSWLRDANQEPASSTCARQDRHGRTVAGVAVDWDADAPEPQHRHVSQICALYPSYEINLDNTPRLAAASRRSLAVCDDKATGWMTVWRINLWAGYLKATGRTAF